MSFLCLAPTHKFNFNSTYVHIIQIKIKSYTVPEFKNNIEHYIFEAKKCLNHKDSIILFGFLVTERCDHV